MLLLLHPAWVMSFTHVHNVHIVLEHATRRFILIGRPLAWLVLLLSSYVTGTGTGTAINGDGPALTTNLIAPSGLSLAPNGQVGHAPYR
jgi:hypothetical protein